MYYGGKLSFNNTQQYLPPIPTHECDLCKKHAILVVQYSAHARQDC